MPAKAEVALSGLKLLLVDDHDLVRRGIKHLLSEAYPKSHFGEARNGKEALVHVTEGWDLILLDISMPGKSGLDLLPEIKKITPRTPVLVLSAFGEEDFAIRTLRAGAAGYVNKRALDAEIVGAVKKVLTGGRYVSPNVSEQLLLEFGRAKPAAVHDNLSEREFQVMRLIASGRTLKEIAGDLGVGEKTIGTYRTRISLKTGLQTQVEITRYAIQQGLVD